MKKTAGKVLVLAMAVLLMAMMPVAALATGEEDAAPSSEEQVIASIEEEDLPDEPDAADIGEEPDEEEAEAQEPGEEEPDEEEPDTEEPDTEEPDTEEPGTAAIAAAGDAIAIMPMFDAAKDDIYGTGMEVQVVPEVKFYVNQQTDFTYTGNDFTFTIYRHDTSYDKFGDMGPKTKVAESSNIQDSVVIFDDSWLANFKFDISDATTGGERYYYSHEVTLTDSTNPNCIADPKVERGAALEVVPSADGAPGEIDVYVYQMFDSGTTYSHPTFSGWSYNSRVRQTEYRYMLSVSKLYTEYGVRTSAVGKDFTMEVYDTDWNLVGSASTIVTGGFDIILPRVYTMADVGTTFRYYVCEKPGTDPDVLYDPQVYVVYVSVENHESMGVWARHYSWNYYNIHTSEEIPPRARGTGMFSFVNERVRAATYALQAEKTFNGATPQDGAFSFTLEDSGGNILQTKSTVNGVVSFDPINFQTAGTHVYTIKEADGGNGEIAYDKTVYTAEIVTAKSDVGVITVESVTYKKDDTVVDKATFDNRSKVSAPVTANKTFDDVAYTGSDYTFRLSAADGTVLQQVSAVSGGAIAFAPLDFTAAGTYTYTITEVKGTDGNVVYDSKTYGVRIVVTNGNGELRVASITYLNSDGAALSGAPTFKNSTVPTTPPTTPEEPNTPTEPDTPTTPAPQTGDSANGLPWMLALGGSTASLLALAVLRRRTKV